MFEILNKSQLERKKSEKKVFLVPQKQAKYMYDN
jgi:hypothetical protein